MELLSNRGNESLVFLDIPDAVEVARLVDERVQPGKH
jgi:hypothetical protein